MLVDDYAEYARAYAWRLQTRIASTWDLAQ